MATPLPGPGRSRHPSTSAVDAAIDRDKLSLWAVVSIAVTGAAPMTVVASGATTGWAVTGVLGIPIAYAVIVVPLLLFAVGYTQMARRITTPGALYAYIARGLGRILGGAGAGVAMIAYSAMTVSCLGAFGAVLSGILDSRYGVHIAWGWLAAAACLVIAVLGVLRVAKVGQILTYALYAEILITAVFTVVEFAHPAGDRIETTTINPSSLWGPGAGAALVTAITCYVGVEVTAVYSREARDPARNIPRATRLAFILPTIMYVLAAWGIAVAAGSKTLVEQAQTNGPELMFVLVGQHVARVWLDCGHLLLCTSLFAAALAFHTTAARYGYALGQERFLPRWMGSVSRTSGAPMAGSLVQSALGLVVILTYVANGWDPLTRLFFWCGVLGGLGVLLLMISTSAAVIAYFRRYPARDLSAWQRWVAPSLAVIGLGTVLGLTLAQFHVSLGVAPNHPARWLLPTLYLAAAAIGMLRAAIMRTTDRTLYDGIGRSYTHSATADRLDSSLATRAGAA